MPTSPTSTSRSISLLGAALLLAACAQTPTSQTPAAGSARFQVLSIPAQVANVVLDLHGDEAATAGDSKSYPLDVQNGTASLNLTNVARGRYTLTARGYDNADHAVVLYKAQVSLTIADNTPISLRMNRATSAITVNATGVTTKSNVLVAKVGGLEARLIASGGSATGTLQGVPTGRGLNVLVEGRDEGGVLRQQGSATVDLSETDQSLSVALGDVQAAAPSVTALSGPASVKQGEAYSLRVQASAGGSETLATVRIEWGDGSSDTLPLTGTSLDTSYSHTYTASGPQRVSVTVTNGAGLSAVASTGVTVTDTASPTVTVDVGAEVVPATLTVTGVPAGTERVQAMVDAPIGAQNVKRQDLKPEYVLELTPRPDGSWGGALGLPAGFTYSVTLRAITGGQTGSSAPQAISTTAGAANSFTLAYTAGGGTASCPAPTGSLTNIGAVQGSGDASPLAGQTVTVRGVVTLDAQVGFKGFYLQDVAPDADPATSDGVFVYTASAPQTVKAGDLVQFSGRVQEFNGLTELDTVQNFLDCGAGTLPKATTLSFPLTSKADLERVEGMLVTVPSTLTVTDNYGLGRYGELGLSSGGRIFNKTNGNGTASGVDDSLRTVYLDDAASAQNPNPIPYLSTALTRRTGDTVAGLTGVVTYGGSSSAPNYRIEPTVAPVFSDANPRPAAPNPVGGSLRVGGANVLNYFTDLNPSYDANGPRGANSAAEFQRQQAKIVNALSGLNADVLTLMETENDTDNTAVNTLTAALNAKVGAGTYAAIQTGRIGTDAIRVAMLYKPAKVATVGDFLVNDNADGVDNRPPLAQTFRDLGTGGVFTVIANHLKSKGSCPTSGDVDSGQGCWNNLRVQQAQKLLNFVQAMQTRSGDQDVILMGDFNSYGAEDPIKTLTAGGFVSENLRIPAADRYSYQFSGAFGYLDHALASSSLDSQITGITEWHINSDEPTNADYNTEFKKIADCVTGTPSGNTCLGQDLWQDNQYRASDHDPVVVGLNLTPDQSVPAFSMSASGAGTVTAGQPYSLTISPSSAPDSLKVNWGDGSADETLSASATGASHSYAAAGSYTITVTAVKGADSKTATVNVSVTASTTGANPWINELHYDNVGTDVDEFVEVAVPAGYDASGLRVYLYNGNAASHAVYGSTSGYALTQAGTSGGYGLYTLSLPANGLQNGGTAAQPEPDGLALCSGNTLIQFLSYEGSFTASGGCADGKTSASITASEDGSNAVGTSLQLTGSGSAYTDFSWTGPVTASKGSVNAGQNLR